MPRLLIVDDEKPQLDALCTLLRDAGHEVTGCEGPRLALEVLGGQSFDLLLSDLQMPELDGIEFVRQATTLDPDLVAILMTGHGSVDSAVEAMKAGVVDYILKPFRMSEMRPVLARAVEIRSLRVANAGLLRQVTQYNAQLQSANRDLDNFAARIAHDLQSVMRVTQGFATLLKRHTASKLDDKERNYLQRIVDASMRGDLLIKDMLAFARLGASPVNARPVALGDVVEQARRTLESDAHGRTVEWDMGPLPQVHVDASLMQQVFVNLLGNALKYTRPREVARISVQAHKVPQGYEIRIRDNGVGFDQDQASRLFQPFERLHRIEDFEGTGMGLANVQRIIERHGGTVRAEAWPGEGAQFSFTLPGGEGLTGAQANDAARPG